MRVRLEDLAQHSVAAVLSLVMTVMTVMTEVLPCVVLGSAVYAEIVVPTFPPTVLSISYPRHNFSKIQAMASCSNASRPVMLSQAHDTHDTM